MKNIRKNLNFDQCLDEIDQQKQQKPNSNDEKEIGSDSLKDKYRSFIANLKIPAPEADSSMKDLEDKSQLQRSELLIQSSTEKIQQIEQLLNRQAFKNE